jgi:hypothetical protein
MYNTHPQNNSYAGQYNGYQSYAPMQQPVQQMPMAAPVAQSSSANMGLLMVAGLAVVGAAAFGGVYLMNSSHDVQPATTASAPSTTVNLPSEINIPGLTTNSDPASPVIVHNNPAPVRVFTSGPANQAPVRGSAPAQGSTPAQGSAPVQAPVSAPTNETKTGTDTTKPGTDTTKTGTDTTKPGTDTTKTGTDTTKTGTDTTKTGTDTTKTGTDTTKTGTDTTKTGTDTTKTGTDTTKTGTDTTKTGTDAPKTDNGGNLTPEQAAQLNKDFQDQINKVGDAFKLPF